MTPPLSDPAHWPRLAELEPRFMRYATDRTVDPPRFISRYVETLAEAQGILFLCPVCFKANNGPIGTHAVLVTFANRGAADDEGSHGRSGDPSRWTVTGDTFDNLTLTPSIDIGPDGCAWHGFIIGGQSS